MAGKIRFWRNRPVLITGGTGFVGSNLAKVLSEHGAKVLIVARFFQKPKVLEKSKNIKFKKGDVQDFDFINRLLAKNNINIVFHLAAQPIVEIGEEGPLQTFNVNIRGTWNLLEAARVNSTQKIIIASSVHVYGNNPNLPFKEEFYPRPSRFYETSKACADLIAQSFADSYGLPIEIPRFVNLYGPGDLNFSRVIPRVMKEIIDNRNPQIWNVGAVRDFLFIEDALKAFLALGEKDLPKKRIRVTNFGTENPINIVELVNKIINLSGGRVEVIFKKRPLERKNEIINQYVSIDKAKKEFNWFPKVNLDEGLKKTLLWYKENCQLLK